jgi:hypothetical protein
VKRLQLLLNLSRLFPDNFCMNRNVKNWLGLSGIEVGLPASSPKDPIAGLLFFSGAWA